MLEAIALDPERAFADLRELLFDATSALHACTDVDQATAALASFDGHRVAALLHRYELSNWVLYAHAYGDPGEGAQSRERALAVDAALRSAELPLEWLVREWVTPALG